MDLMDRQVRLKILADINSEENKQRKAESYKQHEIFSDRQHPWVENYLKGFFSTETVREMPIISSVNLAKRIVTQEASLYKTAPEREYSELSEEQDRVVREITDAMQQDAKLRSSNEKFKLQNQNAVMVLPKGGKLVARVLLQHHYDVIPMSDDPETAFAYIISTYDRTFDQPLNDFKLNAPTGRRVNRDSPLYSDQNNQDIADREDYKKSLERYVVWSREHNFVMDGRGDVISENTDSPIPGVLPFIDIAGEKDFEFFTRQGQAVTDFSIQYNASLTDIANQVRMQGWGQAYLIAEDGVIPQNVQVGPNFIIRLPVNPDTNVRPEFGFAQPNADLAGSQGFLELMLSNFLSSRGVDPKTIAGKADTQRFTSGTERLLAMIEKFEASTADISIYRSVEQQMYNLIKVWHNRLKGTDALLPQFQTQDLPATSKVSVKYHKPEMIETEAEKLDTIQRRLDMKLISRVDAIEMDRHVDTNRAREIMEEIDAEDFGPEPQQGQFNPDDSPRQVVGGETETQG